MTSLDHTLLRPTSHDRLRTETYDDHDEPWQWNWQPGTERTVMTVDPRTQGSTYLVRFPAGYERPDHRRRPDGVAEQFEWHSCHEEIFCLEGSIRFGGWYVLPEMGYLNHPPRWVHPADQHSTEGCLLLIKNSSPCDFVFRDIPQPWDGVEYIDDDTPRMPLPGDATGVTTVGLEDLAWQPVRTRSGEETGVDGRRIYDHPDGRTTWMARVPAGWRAPAGLDAGGAEALFVVDGALEVGGEALDRHGYASSATGLLLAPGAASDSGATLVCWSHGLGDRADLGA